MPRLPSCDTISKFFASVICKINVKPRYYASGANIPSYIVKYRAKNYRSIVKIAELCTLDVVISLIQPF